MTFTDEHKKLIDSETKDVQITLSFPGHEINDIHNNRIYQEELYLEESLIDQEEFIFGKCNGAIFKIKVADFTGVIDRAKMDVSVSIKNDESEMSIPLGKFIVSKAERTADRRYRIIYATDYMTLFDCDISDWFNTILFPESETEHTINEIISMLCEYIGVDYDVDFNLLHGNISIKNPGYVSQINGRDLLENICEINAVFGHFNELGVLTFISVQKSSLYPSNTLYPKDDLYPRGLNDNQTHRFSKYRSCEYEDYNVKEINSVKIRNSDDDLGVVASLSGVTDDNINQYNITGNIFLSRLSVDELQTVANNLLIEMKSFEYRPNKTIVDGGIYLQLGDIYKMNVKYFLEDEIIENYFESTVLKRTITGIQSIKTTVEAKGKQYQTDIIDTTTQIDLIRNRTAKVEKSIDGLSVEFKDFENDTGTKFEQTADSIRSKVSKGSVSSEISQEAGKVSIKGNRLSVESDNFKLTEDGFLTISGNIACDNALIMREPITKQYFNVLSIEKTVDNRISSVSMNDISGGHFIKYTAASASVDAESDWFFNGLYVGIKGNLSVSGQKNRIVKTKDYGIIKQYAYETASPMFGDIGHGIIGDDGSCFVDIDDIFSETVDLVHEYYVFLQTYSNDRVFVKQKNPSYFVVSGIPGTEFDWEIKAKQRDYTLDRLEEYKNDGFADYDYEALAIKYLEDYEKEIVSYD